MDEMKQALRELLREELAPIHQKLDEQGSRLDKHDEYLAVIIKQLDRMEKSQNEDVIAILEIMNSKFDRLEARDDYQDHKIGLLNERIFRLETDVRQLTRK